VPVSRARSSDPFPPSAQTKVRETYESFASSQPELLKQIIARVEKVSIHLGTRKAVSPICAPRGAQGSDTGASSPSDAGPALYWYCANRRGSSRCARLPPPNCSALLAPCIRFAPCWHPCGPRRARRTCLWLRAWIAGVTARAAAVCAIAHGRQHEA
jgi:hypothetical protein